MIFSLPLALVTSSLVLALLYQIARRREVRRMESDLQERREAKDRGSHKAQLQYPHIDLSRCLGCGACVRACPEEGVLGLIHGQAAVLHGARCVGHGLCAKECPVDAITITLGDLKDRKDIPALTSQFEAVDSPGLFLAGEVTGHALIRTAVAHGEAVADAVAVRCGEQKGTADVLDLCIVGAGPAGFSCSLQAKAKGLRFVTIDQESLGGTVSKYPRRKLVMTQPVRLPLHGWLKATSFQKEELMELWTGLAKKHSLPIRTGVEFQGLERVEEGHYVVRTSKGAISANNVVLALGRRGTPRKLGIPGEDLPNVAYNLIDAQSYEGRNILVVGGGDSAIEAALALAEQPGNQVSISYRQAAFSRLKVKNEKRIAEALGNGQIQGIFQSQAKAITPTDVVLEVKGESGAEEWVIPNDEVFIMAGGVPPFSLLEKAGVSFDATKMKPADPLGERGTNAIRGTLGALIWAAAAWGWFAWYQQYYVQNDAARFLHPLHEQLRATGRWGLIGGIAAVVAIIANLLYLPRRAMKGSWIPGSLKAWMTSHIVTGTLALLLAWIHAGLRPHKTAGGYAFYALVVLGITGAIGRYFYALVPRAANGREAALEDLSAKVAAQSAEWDRHGRGFGEEARKEIQKLTDQAASWRGGFFGSLFGFWRQRSGLKATLKRLRQSGRKQGLSTDQVKAVVALAQRSHQTSMMAGHFEQLRGLLGAWRFFHRILAIVMVGLLILHIGVALRYAKLF